MTTLARPTEKQGSHWYTQSGEACYEVKRADGTGMRPTTLADARKLSLLPSVTTILKVLAKPGLEAWKTEQVALSLLTTPRPPEEPLDAFVQRVLHDERQQDEERDTAASRGVLIHGACEDHFNGRFVDPDTFEWVEPAVMALAEYGKFEASEVILVGDGYAGRTDLITRIDATIGERLEWIFDFKHTKKLPKEPYPEHVMQLAAYAKARHRQGIFLAHQIHTANVYISSTEKGKFVIHEHEPWLDAWAAFECLLSYWKWVNSYP